MSVRDLPNIVGAPTDITHNATPGLSPGTESTTKIPGTTGLLPGDNIPEPAPVVPFVQPAPGILDKPYIVEDVQDVGKNISLRASNAPRRIAYGYTRMGGVYTFAQLDEGENGQFLHLVITFTGHQIKSFEKLYIDDQLVTFGGGGVHPGDTRWGSGDWTDHVFWATQSVGADDQAANSDLVSQSNQLFPGKWTAEYRQRGCSLLYIILAYHPTLFKSWPPKITAEGYWRSDIYDPRTATTGWTDNAALVLANFLTDTKYGMGIDYSRIDETSLITAANACDETIASNYYGLIKRYTINGSFQSSSKNSRQQILQELLKHMAGDLIYSSGKFYIKAGVWDTPTVTLDEDDLRSQVRVRVLNSISETFNAVQGNYVSDYNNWEESSYPIVKNDTYEEEDGGDRLTSDLNLPLCKYPNMAMRVAKIHLETERQTIVVEAIWGLNALQLMAGDNVMITLSRFGWNQKIFKVKQLKLTQKKSGNGSIIQVSLSLKETASAIYDWNDGFETKIDLAPNTDLPEPGTLLAPQNLTFAAGTSELYSRVDGTTFSRILLAWDSPTNPFVVYYRVRYRKSDDTEWQYSAQVPVTGESTNKTYILDVEDGNYYDVAVAAVDYLNIESSWTTLYHEYVYGKQENPTTPINFSSIAQKTGILLSWDAISDKDLLCYEIRVGSSWASGTTILHDNVISHLWATQGTGEYDFFLRAIDRSGNYSNTVTTSLTVFAPGEIQDLTTIVVHNHVRLNWEAPEATTFPVSGYNIYSGTYFNTSELIGKTEGTFTSFLEQVGGTYTYWITALDVHGNEGEATSVTLDVEDPLFFEIRSDDLLDLNDANTLTYAIVETVGDDTQIVCPINKTETWAEHLTRVGGDATTTLADIISSYPIYIQPPLTGPAVVDFIKDYGVELSGFLVTFDYGYTIYSGSPTITPSISYAGADQVYTKESGVSQLFINDTQYIKPELQVTGGLISIDYIRLRIDVKMTRDGGSATLNAADHPTGTWITFNETFIDIDVSRIKLIYRGSSPRIVQTTFSDTPNPTGMYALAWDLDGNAQDVTVDWEVWGVKSKT